MVMLNKSKVRRYFVKKSRAVGRKTFLIGGINAKIEVQESKDPSPLLSGIILWILQTQGISCAGSTNIPIPKKMVTRR